MIDRDNNAIASPQSEAAAKVSLLVLPHSGKVDQLRREGLSGASIPIAQGESVTSDVSAPISTPSRSDAIASAAPPVGSTEPGSAMRKKLLEAKVIQVLRKIYDPEIPIDIYELGLIYEIAIGDDDSVRVQMTLTAPACPVAGSLPGQVEQQIESIPEVKSAEVVLVWDPPWSRDRMSEAALLQLGML